MKTQTRVHVVALICAALLCCAGCGTTSSLTASDRDTAVFVLFDMSGSTDSSGIRNSYLHDLAGISEALSRTGGVLRGDIISSNALNTSAIPIDVTFPVYDKLFSTEKKHKQQIATATHVLNEQAATLLAHTDASPQTAIMASLEVASKILNGEHLKGAKRKRLVVFSDMVEESGRYNFQKEHLTQTRIKAIIEAEKSSGRLPDLHGIKVWKSGSSALDLSDDRSRALQTFWVQYFAAAGADLTPDRYGSTLLNFSLE